MLLIVIFVLSLFSIGLFKLSDEHMLVLLTAIFLSFIVYIVHDMFATMANDENFISMTNIEIVDSIASESNARVDIECELHEKFNNSSVNSLAALGELIPDVLLDTYEAQCEIEIDIEFFRILDTISRHQSYHDEVMMGDIIDSLDFYSAAQSLVDVDSSLVEELDVDNVEAISLVVLTPDPEIRLDCDILEVIDSGNFLADDIYELTVDEQEELLLVAMDDAEIDDNTD